MAQVDEDVLEELDRDLLRLREPVALHRAIAGGRQLDHRPDRVVRLRRDAHPLILTGRAPSATLWSTRASGARHGRRTYGFLRTESTRPPDASGRRFPGPRCRPRGRAAQRRYLRRRLPEVPRAVPDVDRRIRQIADAKGRASGAERDPLRRCRAKLHQPDRARFRAGRRVELRFLVDDSRKKRRVEAAPPAPCRGRRHRTRAGSAAARTTPGS